MAKSASFRFDCRLTGLFYLGFAFTGALGFLMIRAELFATGDPAQTLANLLELEGLARIGIALELGLVVFQALAATWFAKLFRDTDAFAAGALALFGMVNAIVVLAGVALMRTALDVALEPLEANATTSHILFLIGARFWEAGHIFFGLWLIPMGWLTWKAEFGPRLLGWILILGGVGYVVSPFVTVLAPDIGAWVAVFPILAAVGEFWMIGLLLWTGLRPQRG